MAVSQVILTPQTGARTKEVDVVFKAQLSLKKEFDSYLILKAQDSQSYFLRLGIAMQEHAP